MTKEFELACNELGWGDPERALWFVGLEEADTWKLDAGMRLTIPQLREKVHNHFDHPDPFRPPDLDAAPDPSTSVTEKRYMVREIQAKICAVLVSGDLQKWQQWRDSIWKPGSNVAQANLFPLGRPNHSAWPAHYEELFGVSQSDYRRRVEELRFPRFRFARAKLRPQAIVCFGTGEHDAFTECFKIERTSHRALAGGKLRVYDEERILMTPFFDYRYLGGDTTIRAIAEILRDWDVRIGPE